MSFTGPTLESIDTSPVYDAGGLTSYSQLGQLEEPTALSQIDLGGSGTFVGFDANANPTDPTNSGDTGGVQNTSTAPIAGINNPETGGISNWGSVISNSLNAAFASWQLASQPRTTPKTITTRVGTTSVTSGGGVLSGILGPSATSGNNLVLLLIAAVVIIYFVARK